MTQKLSDFVLKLIAESQNGLTVDRLVEMTGAPERKVRYSVCSLRSYGYIKSSERERRYRRGGDYSIYIAVAQKRILPQDIILDFIVSIGPMNCDQLAELTGYERIKVKKNIEALVKKEKIVPTEFKRFGADNIRRMVYAVNSNQPYEPPVLEVEKQAAKNRADELIKKAMEIKTWTGDKGQTAWIGGSYPGKIEVRSKDYSGMELVVERIKAGAGARAAIEGTDFSRSVARRIQQELGIFNPKGGYRGVNQYTKEAA